MNPEEYTALANVERDHWFYKGKRVAVRRWIERLCKPNPSDLLADVGAGTGRFAVECADLMRPVAVDDHEESLDYLRRLSDQIEVRNGSCAALPFTNGEVRVATALDVIEHVEDDAGALAELHRILAPGGWLVLTVPALMALWSDWDVSLHHYRRYNKKNLRDLVTNAGFDIVELRYTNGFVMPAVWTVRTWRKIFPPKTASRQEDKIPPAFLNRMLHRWYLHEATNRVWKPPLGVGLLLAARKPVAPASTPADDVTHLAQ